MINAISKSMFLGSVLLVSIVILAETITPEPKADLSGTWTLTIETPMGISNPILTIWKSADGYDGTYESRRGKRGVEDIQVTGQAFSFRMMVSMPMGDFEMVYKGSIDGEKISGTIGNSMGEVAFVGRRSK
ncbi:uncharacterized protein METZ01_LOCUS125102 [marine metagenome]|uniref:Lipocalin-like domain-containing protein n=1 Tax=marine metagenome TaxID=408172 RepID=A0A381Y5E9_9ZZZZ